MAEPDTTRVARDLLMLSALTRRVLEASIAAGDGEVTPTQVVILKWLDRAPPRRALDVARFLSASAPAATQILARMKRRGLVSMRRSRTDARAAELSVTSRGRAAVRKHERRRERRMAALLAGVPAAERQRIAESLEAAIALFLRGGTDVDDMCLHCDALSSPHCVMRLHGRACAALC